MPLGVQNIISSSSLGFIQIWLYPKKPSINDNISCYVVAFTMSTVMGSNVCNPYWILNFLNKANFNKLIDLSFNL